MEILKYPTIEEIQWVVDYLKADPWNEHFLQVQVLTEIPTIEKFKEIVKEMDWEIRGGTWENPKWAWEEHPWYKLFEFDKDKLIEEIFGD